MTYFQRFLLYNRYPQPHYQPIGSDTLLDRRPVYEPGKVYRLRLASSTDDLITWPEFVVIKLTSQVEHQGIVVAVFVVLLSDYEQFVAPFLPWELN